MTPETRLEVILAKDKIRVRETVPSVFLEEPLVITHEMDYGELPKAVTVDRISRADDDTIILRLTAATVTMEPMAAMTPGLRTLTEKLRAEKIGETDSPRGRRKYDVYKGPRGLYLYSPGTDKRYGMSTKNYTETSDRIRATIDANGGSMLFNDVNKLRGSIWQAVVLMMFNGDIKITMVPHPEYDGVQRTMVTLI